MIYLASQSPRRRELLKQINIPFRTVSVEINETPRADESPRDYVKRMAMEKAQHALAADMKFPLLAADTTVVCGTRIFGKPADKADFLQMMQILGGNTHQVMTSVAVAATGREAKIRLCISEVKFKPVSNLVAQRYWETGEPRDKAGGYGIQGLGAIFIEQIHGSYSGIMGLPLYETAELLSEFGVYSI